MSDYLYHAAAGQNASAANASTGPAPINQLAPAPYTGPSYSGDLRQPVLPPVTPPSHPQAPPAAYVQSNPHGTYPNPQTQVGDRLVVPHMQPPVSETGSDMPSASTLK